nr:MAG TPA: hypothetical protein [Crassvirales sp.]DAH40579.1 MAG TPA: hypothetical protein [Caudoviricetes sp.]
MFISSSNAAIKSIHLILHLFYFVRFVVFLTTPAISFY